MLSRAELLNVFVICAQSASFREAAVKLNMSPQSVSRIIKTLETTFGELLFHRDAKQVKITKFGEALLEKADKALYAVDEVFSNSVDAESLSGKVTIAAPTEIAGDHIFPALMQLNTTYPDINVSVRASSHYSHLIDEQIDIGLRVGPVKDNRFIVKRLNTMHFHLVAALSLLEKFGTPSSTDALNAFPFVDSIDAKTGKSWPWDLKSDIELKPANVGFHCFRRKTGKAGP